LFEAQATPQSSFAVWFRNRIVMAKLLLSLAVVAVILVVSQAHIYPPGGCYLPYCSSYSGLALINTSTSYSTNPPWVKQPLAHLLAYINASGSTYRNPFLPSNINTSTYAFWQALKNSTYVIPSLGTTYPVPALNFQDFVLEAGFYTLVGQLSLSACCTKCAQTDKCVIYRYEPPAGATTTDAAGNCYTITGGTDLGWGPYNLTTHASLGAPAVNIAATPAYQGGYCNPLAGVTDDPHFTGAHGTKYDFNGDLDKSFCLVTDSDFHINTIFKGYVSSNTYHATKTIDGMALRTWIREVGFLWKGGHSLHMVAREGKQQERGNGFISKAVVDGQAINVPSQPGEKFVSGDMSLTLVGVEYKGPYEIENYRLIIGNLLDASISLRVAHQLLQTPDSAEVHFNLKFNDLQVSEKVHGILGQTYRDTPEQLTKSVRYSELARLLNEPIVADGETGKGFLDGSVDDYVSSNVLKADCKISSFSQ
jgi:hypothetical protein